MAGPTESGFAPILAEPATAMTVAPALAAASVSAIEVELAGTVVRVLPGMAGALLTVVLRAVRASAGGA